MWNNLIVNIINGKAASNLLEAAVRMDKANWIALIAHYLDLRALPLDKQPSGGLDPDTGEITPESFSRWRGIRAELFKRKLKQYSREAEKYRKTAQHKRLLQKITRVRPVPSWHRHKAGRRVDPVKTFEKVKLVAAYLDAKEENPGLKSAAFAKAHDMPSRSFSNYLRDYKNEAESYRHLTKAGEHIEPPQPYVPLTAAQRTAAKKIRDTTWNKYAIDLGYKLEIGRLQAKDDSDVIANYAKEHKLNVAELTSEYEKRKGKHIVRVGVAKRIGGIIPSKHLVKEKPAKKKKKKKVEPVLFPGRASYRKTRKGDEETAAWINLAHEVESKGLTKQLIIDYADLVGVSVIKKVKRFPKDWGNKQIRKWMSRNVDEYARLAGPQLKAKLKKLGIWNPPEEKTRAVPTFAKQTTVSGGEPWLGLRGWSLSRRPIVAIVGGTPSRNLKAHKWLDTYFDVISVGTQAAGRKGGTGVLNKITDALASHVDLLILLTGFMKHVQINKAKTAISSNIPVISNIRGKALKAIPSAAAAAKHQSIAPWFVDAYEKEKGVIHDSINCIIYSLLEGVSLESILA